jgi:hypothetical protein
MQVRSPELFQKLEKLATQYNSNIASTYIKSELPSLTLSRRDWDEIELITVRQELFRHQGYHLDELYLKLLALARLVKQARVQWGSSLKNLVSIRYANRPASERVLAEMTAANFMPNLAVLADIIRDLYELARKEDAEQNGGKLRSLASVPEAKEIPTLLQLPGQ